MLRNKFSIHPISHIPAQVDVADIDASSGRLMSLKEFGRYRQQVDASCGEGDGKCSKKVLHSRFSIAKFGRDYFAIYKGEKHGKLLGKGSFGAVKLAQNIKDGTWVVLKTLQNKKAHREDVHNKIVALEVSNLKRTNQFVGHYQSECKLTGLQHVIAMPLVQGISVKRIITQREMPAVKWIDLAIQMVESAYNLQKLGLIHRDIKPENMLCDPVTSKVKLIDFGLTRQIHSLTNTYWGSRCGTNRYMAPELFAKRKKRFEYGEATEIYALGISLLECFHMQRVPQGSSGDVVFYAKIRNALVREQLLDLVARMLKTKPAKRPGFEDVLKRLHILREEHLDVISKVNALVYLDVHGYQQATLTQRKHALQALLGADEVQLVSVDGKFDERLSFNIKHELECAGVFVAGELLSIYELDKHQFLNRLKHFMVNKSTEKDIIYSAYYIKTLTSFTDNSGICFSRTVDRCDVAAEHKQMVLDNIAAQASRLQNKNPFDPRLTVLQDFYTSFVGHPGMNYRTLFNNLYALQSQIDETKKAIKKQRLLRFFGGGPTTTKKIVETSQEVSRDLHGLNKRNSNH